MFAILPNYLLRYGKSRSSGYLLRYACHQRSGYQRRRFEQKKSNIITGTIYDPEADEYSYSLVNYKTKDTLQKGNFKLNANDTLPYERSFSVEINAKVETGRYYFSVCRKDDYNIQFDSHQINIE